MKMPISQISYVKSSFALIVRVKSPTLKTSNGNILFEFMRTETCRPHFLFVIIHMLSSNRKKCPSIINCSTLNRYYLKYDTNWTLSNNFTMSRLVSTFIAFPFNLHLSLLASCTLTLCVSSSSWSSVCHMIRVSAINKPFRLVSIQAIKSLSSSSSFFAAKFVCWSLQQQLKFICSCPSQW